MIKISHLTKSFENKIAVNQIDLEVSNELFIFLGPNGAGKTTTIKMMTGLLKPDEGEVTLNGIDIARQPLAAKAQFGYVPEQPNLYEKLTPREFIDFIIRVYKAPYKPAMRRMQQLFDIFEIADRADDLIEEFSSGMHKKRCPPTESSV